MLEHVFEVITIEINGVVLCPIYMISGTRDNSPPSFPGRGKF